MTKGISIIALAVLQMVSLNYVNAAPPRPVATPMAVSNPDAWTQDGKHVELAISVVEDLTASFAEFPDLQNGVLMISESGTTLGAVRIMQKHQLAKSVSAPKITCNIGDQAEVSTGPDAVEKTNGNSDTVAVEVTPRSAQKGLDGMEMWLELKAQTNQNGVKHGCEVGFLIKEGQTAVVKAQQRTRTNGGKNASVYVVVTPKLVK